MIRKCSLMFSLIALTTFLSVQNPHAKPVGNRFTTSVTLGPAVFPMPGIRFQYRFNDHLSLNSGLSYIVAAGDFNAGINFHLPVNSIDPYLGARRIFIYHLTGSIDLSEVLPELKQKTTLWKQVLDLVRKEQILAVQKQSWQS